MSCGPIWEWEDTMGRILGATALVLSWGLGIGCASLVSPGPDYVPVSSTPPDAKVSLDGVDVGRTPLIIPFSRTCEGVLRFELPGYESRTLDVDKVLNGWFLGNVLWFPIWPVVPLGVAVDLIGSNQGKYSTSPIHVDLKPLARPAP
jgi:hypothetical protein